MTIEIFSLKLKDFCTIEEITKELICVTRQIRECFPKLVNEISFDYDESEMKIGEMVLDQHQTLDEVQSAIDQSKEILAKSSFLELLINVKW